MPDKKLTDELLNELLDAPNIDGYIKEHDFAAPSLSNYLKQLLQEKGLERSRVVRMADLNETFGYQIFTGARHPSRNKVLQIAFAMALTLKETNRALTAAGVSVLNCKDRPRCDYHLLHRSRVQPPKGQRGAVSLWRGDGELAADI